MASSVEHCCGVERLRRNESPARVWLEEDYRCSSPTSWEFHGLGSGGEVAGSSSRSSRGTGRTEPSSSPPQGGMGLLSVLQSSSSGSSPCGKAEDSSNSRCGSGSNSSTGSHRSRDSGFSDSGGGGGCAGDKHQRRRNQGRRKSHVIHETDSRVNVSPGRRSFDETYVKSSAPPPPSQTFIVPPPDMVNGSLAPQYKQYKVCCPHSPVPSDDTYECGNSIYQEVILAHPHADNNASTISTSTLPPDLATVGAPACCSTPKGGNKNGGTTMKDWNWRMGKIIDNFQSLNKNKLLDSNNNKNLTPTSTHYDSNGNSILVGSTTYNVSTTQKSFHSGQENDSIKDRSVYSTSSVYNGGNNNNNVNTTTASKYQSLPRGFQRVQHTQQTKREEEHDGSREVIIVRSQADNDALRLWLHELRYQAEPECLHVLQSKSVSDVLDETDSNRRQEQGDFGLNGPSSVTLHSVSVPLMSIRYVEQMASTISGQFSKICKHLEFGFFAQVPPLVESLVDHLDEFLKRQSGLPEGSSSSSSSYFGGSLHKLEHRLASSCYELRMAAQSLTTLLLTSSSSCSSCSSSCSSSAAYVSPNGSHLNQAQHSPDTCQSCSSCHREGAHRLQRQFHFTVAEIVEGIVALGNLFGQVVDQRLTRDLSCILDTIEGGGLAGSVALKAFATILHDGGMHICRLAASIRTVRGLLGVLLDAKENSDRILALRCLATILCVGEAVKDFDKAGGFEIVADILHDSGCSIVIKLEAVSVLAQATDPWIDLESTLMNLGYHLERIIVSLTNMISYCHSHEDGFLLTIAAISNLTFLEVSSLELLRRHRTIPLIINAIKGKADFSIFVLDHVATVLANMAGAEKCRKEIVRSGGIVTLLCFLQQRPLPFESAAEIAACERLQQKSTIAISRLCNEPGVPQMVVEMGGLERMIQLCRLEKERNYSDGVLIACLATIRKLVTFCGEKATQGLQADDLIQPRLLDSFLMYSSRQESYV